MKSESYKSYYQQLDKDQKQLEQQEKDYERLVAEKNEKLWSLNNQQMKQLKHLLNLEMRTKQQTIEIFELIKTHPFLSDFMSANLVEDARSVSSLAICKTMRIENFKESEIIMEQDQMANDKLYIIVQGSAVVVKKSNNQNINDMKQMKILMQSQEEIVSKSQAGSDSQQDDKSLQYRAKKKNKNICKLFEENEVIQKQGNLQNFSSQQSKESFNLQNDKKQTNFLSDNISPIMEKSNDKIQFNQLEGKRFLNHYLKNTQMITRGSFDNNKINENFGNARMSYSSSRKQSLSNNSQTSKRSSCNLQPNQLPFQDRERIETNSNSGFGEIALLSKNSLRNATVIASKNTTCLVITREQYRGIVNSCNIESYQKEKTLQVILPQLIEMQWEKKRKILNLFSFLTKGQGEYLIREQLPGDSVYFLVHGKICIQKKVDNENEPLSQDFQMKKNLKQKNEILDLMEVGEISLIGQEVFFKENAKMKNEYQYKLDQIQQQIKKLKIQISKPCYINNKNSDNNNQMKKELLEEKHNLEKQSQYLHDFQSKENFADYDYSIKILSKEAIFLRLHRSGFNVLKREISECQNIFQNFYSSQSQILQQTFENRVQRLKKIQKIKDVIQVNKNLQEADVDQCLDLHKIEMQDVYSQMRNSAYNSHISKEKQMQVNQMNQLQCDLGKEYKIPEQMRQMTDYLDMKQVLQQSKYNINILRHLSNNAIKNMRKISGNKQKLKMFQKQNSKEDNQQEKISNQIQNQQEQKKKFEELALIKYNLDNFGSFGIKSNSQNGKIIKKYLEQIEESSQYEPDVQKSGANLIKNKYIEDQKPNEFYQQKYSQLVEKLLNQSKVENESKNKIQQIKVKVQKVQKKKQNIDDNKEKILINDQNQSQEVSLFNKQLFQGFDFGKKDNTYLEKQLKLNQLKNSKIKSLVSLEMGISGKINYFDKRLRRKVNKSLTTFKQKDGKFKLNCENSEINQAISINKPVTFNDIQDNNMNDSNNIKKSQKKYSDNFSIQSVKSCENLKLDVSQNIVNQKQNQNQSQSQNVVYKDEIQISDFLNESNNYACQKNENQLQKTGRKNQDNTTCVQSFAKSSQENLEMESSQSFLTQQKSVNKENFGKYMLERNQIYSQNLE
ncbi:Cyclic nucleotide-binding protein [Pseudocohnilembus persalinus]|uniref:Cyclic nucleotide-binding protein n=1 Tax=Pseudocohnilembus persalinus TaxID=266149 RepID=A0A0V0QW90_PSEPJ|nr:Cyclic nucleotide-binding protein [Pseudocohnilembus persalinus]|eukprot:KRX06591.1 Cyclic nucleotide-binding protein [Pseudocohnilembus persalinus]